jgi:WD40 repeat protein
MAAQTMLLAWCAKHDSFTWDETAHLPAGLSHWELGNFDLYRVNPPLVRMVATLPLLLAGYESAWEFYTPDVRGRPEWPVSQRFIEANGIRSFWLLTLARWACLPFSWLGMWICWRWGRDLFGEAAGCLAATLWGFSPNILAHGHLITPDVGATAFGIAAFYLLWHWLREPNWTRAWLAGIVFGLAQASKGSWIILFGLWPALWLLWRGPALIRGGLWRREGLQLLAMLLVGVWSINTWYGFEGSFQRLGDYQFLSRSLGGSQLEEGQLGNKFAGTWMANLPVPLPRNYVQGIDRQKHHFERPDWSYLAGEWRNKGWWHYYVYAVAVKEPLGTWLLGLLALILCLARRSYRTDWRTEWLLIASFCVMLFFISSQRGFNRHLRYALPVFPLAFVWLSRAAVCLEQRSWKIVSIGGAAVVWSVASSLSVCPHFLSYFNELGGGPTGGHAHLLSSNVDWGQDLLYLQRWVEAHPEARPLRLNWHVSAIDPKIVGLQDEELPARPKPGWYAISVCDIRGRSGRYKYFLQAQPVAWAGYSIPIYHLTESDCERIERSLGWLKTVPQWDVIGHGESEIRCCALSSDGDLLITGGGDRVARVWDLQTRSARKWAEHPDAVTAVTLLENPRRLVTGCADGSLHVGVVDSGDRQPLPSPHRQAVNQFVLDQDRSRLATVSQDGLCCVWRSAALSKLWQTERTLPALSAAFSADGRWLAIGFGKRNPKVVGQVCIFEAETGALVADLPESNDFVKGVAFSADGSLIAARGTGGGIRLWSTKDWRPQRPLEDSMGTSRLQFVEGSWLLSSDFRGEVKLWDATASKLLIRFQAHEQLVNDFVMTPNARQLITVSRDGHIKAWDFTEVVTVARRDRQP